MHFYAGLEKFLCSFWGETIHVIFGNLHKADKYCAAKVKNENCK